MKMFKKMIAVSIALVMVMSTSAVVSASTPNIISKTLSGKSKFDSSLGDDSWCKKVGSVDVGGIYHADMYGKYDDNMINDKVKTYISNCPYGVYRWSYINSGGTSRMSSEVKDGSAPTEMVTLKNSKAVFKICIYS